MYVCGGVWPSLSYNQWEEVVILTAQCRYTNSKFAYQIRLHCGLLWPSNLLRLKTANIAQFTPKTNNSVNNSC